jgi:3',5'-cyclic AMP phosphodiesterase CpdA
MTNPIPLARILVLSDPQIGLYRSVFEQARTNSDRLVAAGKPALDVPEIHGHERERVLFTEAITAANELRPDCVVVCGDMVQHWDSDEELGLLREIAGELDPEIPLHWVPGNHDVAPDTFSPTADALARYRESFGADRYAVEYGRVRLIAINSTSIDRPEFVPGERNANLEFLEAELAAADRADQIPVVCSHHPWFLDERHPAASLAIASDQLPALESIAEAGRLRTLLAGHIHGNALDVKGQLQQITTTAVGLAPRDDLSGYRVLDVFDDHLEHMAHSLPSGADLKDEAKRLWAARSGAAE